MQNSLSLNFPTKHPHAEVSHVNVLFYTLLTKDCAYFKVLTLSSCAVSLWSCCYTAVILPYCIIHNRLLYFIPTFLYIRDLNSHAIGEHPDHSSQNVLPNFLEDPFPFFFK